MTREEILALEAGRELDALVAKKVMGWHLVRWADETDGGRVWKGDAGEYRAPYSVDPNPKWRWSPSTDIAAAWEVVDALMDNGIGLPQIFHDGQLWVASVSDCTRKKSNMASALTAPLAICRAALLAVML